MIIDIKRFKDATLFKNFGLGIVNIKTYYDVSFIYTDYQEFTAFDNINIKKFSFRHDKRNLNLDVRDEV